MTPIFLISYVVVQGPHHTTCSSDLSLSWRQGGKQDVGISSKCKRQLDAMCVTRFLSHMDSWVVTPCQDCTQLANEQLWRSWTPVLLWAFGNVQHSWSIERGYHDSWRECPVCLYNGQSWETLDILRLQRFCQKVSTKTIRVAPRTLPATSASAKQHCLRVYVQVQQWQRVGIDANGWGWAIHDVRMVPVMTEMKPAPDYLLDVIHCGWKADCSTRRCSCRKYNLESSSTCSECKGLHCSNVTLPEPESDPEEEYTLAGPKNK